MIFQVAHYLHGSNSSAGVCANLVQGDKFSHVMDGGYKVRIMIERRGLTMIKWPLGGLRGHGSIVDSLQ